MGPAPVAPKVPFYKSTSPGRHRFQSFLDWGAFPIVTSYTIHCTSWSLNKLPKLPETKVTKYWAPSFFLNLERSSISTHSKAFPGFLARRGPSKGKPSSFVESTSSPTRSSKLSKAHQSPFQLGSLGLTSSLLTAMVSWKSKKCPGYQCRSKRSLAPLIPPSSQYSKMSNPKLGGVETLVTNQLR